MSFHLSIITPQGKVFDDTVDSVAVTGYEGDFEVYTKHAFIVSALKAGKIKVRKDGEKVFTTSSGILEVVPPEHNVTILVDSSL